MADTVGSIQVVATINTKDYDTGKKKIESGNADLEKGASQTTSRFSGLWSVAGKAVAASLAAVGIATAALVTKSVKDFANYEQLVGGVDTLFKNSSKAVQEYADNAYKTAGLSANQYMETVTSFSASLLQGLAGDTKKAAQVSNLAVTDMADNANKMGTDMARIQDAYQGFAKDNFMMLDNLKLGYGGTAGEMARLVNDSGSMGDSFKATAENVKDIPFDKLIESIHTVQTNLGITGTTAKEASDTVSGSAHSMLSSWQNLLTGLSNPNADFGKLIDQFVESTATFAGNVMPVMERALDGVVKLVATLLPKIVTALPGLIGSLLPAVISTFVSLVVSLAQALPKLIPTLVKGTMQLLNGILDAIPKILPPLIEGVIALFNGAIKIISTPGMLSKIIIASLTLFMAILTALPTVLDALIQAIPMIIAAIVGFLTDPKVLSQLIKASVLLFMALVLAVPQVLGSLVSAFGTLISELWDRIKGNFTTFAANFGNGIGNAVKSGINGVLGWIERQVNGIIDNVNGMLKKIDDIVPGNQSGMRVPRLSIPKLADGGIVSRATLALVGEGSEPEAVIPLSKLDSMMENSGGSGNRAKTDVTLNLAGLVFSSKSDKRQFANEIGRLINESSKAKIGKISIEGV